MIITGQCMIIEKVNVGRKRPKLGSGNNKTHANLYSGGIEKNTPCFIKKKS